MMSSEVQASIVIPTLNGGAEFRRCLEMIGRQRSDGRVEVVVIDSGSSDGTLEAARRFGARTYQIRPREFNHGRTRQWGADLAAGEYVVFCSQDAVPADEHWLSLLLGNFQDRTVAGVYCRQIPRDDADVLTKQHLNGWLTGREQRAVSFVDDREAYRALPPWERYALCNFDNVCAGVRRSVCQAIPYPETYIAEDLGWGKAIIEAGYKLVYEPRAAVVHSHRRSLSYEYSRTYLVHRRVYALFGLRAVPTWRHALRFTVGSIVRDTQYVLKEERSWRRKLSLIGKIPALSAARILAQYRGASDEMRARPLKRIAGV